MTSKKQHTAEYIQCGECPVSISRYERDYRYGLCSKCNAEQDRLHYERKSRDGAVLFNAPHHAPPSESATRGSINPLPCGADNNTARAALGKVGGK